MKSRSASMSGGPPDNGRRSLDVVTVGETLACLAAPEGRLDAARVLTKTIGGSESNTAVGLVRLGRSAAWVSRVGQDPFGDEIVRTLRGEGVDVSAVTRSPDAATAVMVRERRAVNEIHVHYYRSASAARQLSAGSIPDELVASARRVHLTGITLGLGPGPRAAVHRTIELARDNGLPISFDPNIRRKLWPPDAAAQAIGEVLPHVTDLLANEDEAMVLTGTDHVDDAITVLEQKGIPVVVVKCGAKGAVGLIDGQRIEVPAVGVAVTDTVGAGDAFNAGYLHARLADEDLESALVTGAWVAGRVVAHHGDWEGLPTAEELDAWWSTDPVVTR